MPNSGGEQKSFYIYFSEILIEGRFKRFNKSVIFQVQDPNKSYKVYY